MVRQRAGLLPSAYPQRAGLISGLWKVKIIIPAYPRRWGGGGHWIQMTGAYMTLIEAVAAVQSKYMTIWPREVDGRSA